MSKTSTRNVAATTLILLISLSILPTLAAAQDTPYSPKQIPRSKLIDLGDFSRSPLQFPWAPVRVTTTSNPHGTLDFEHLLNESFDDVMGYFKSNQAAKKPVVQLSSDVMRYSKVTELFVSGFEINANDSKVTLGAIGLPRNFYIKVEKQGNQTKLTVLNTAHTQEFSGVMPARAPLRPVGANPITFRWN